MSCTLKDPTLVPPEGYWYREPSTGVKRDGGAVTRTIILVLEHRQSNGLPRATIEEITADVNQQICQRVPHNFCYGDCTIALEHIGREQLLDGLKVIGKRALAWLTGRDPFVDQAEADRRASICTKCFLNAGAGEGCMGCGFVETLRETMKLTIGERATAFDAKLQACRVCGCLNKAQVWYSDEILNATMNNEDRARFAQVTHCWKNGLAKEGQPQ